LWLLSRHSLHLRGPIQQHGSPDLRVFTTEETPSAEQNSWDAHSQRHLGDVSAL